MKKVVYINENYKYITDNSDIKEGGFSRNFYLMKWFQSNIKNLKEITLRKNTIINMVIVIYELLKPGRNILLFQYPLLGFPIFNKSFFSKFTNAILNILIRNALITKEIIFDISDLKYEQSLDLNIESDAIDKIKKFEDVFFKMPATYVFASESMRSYAQAKYNINYQNTDVCRNGSINVEKVSNIDIEKNYTKPDKINFVYAGSLNKGRQIELMLKNFPKNDKINLILMGSEGDWIREAINQDNIEYLGALSELDAFLITSSCDIGLIPYDNRKNYYNIAYPTKLSFYLSAGVPFLSTPVKEVIDINSRLCIGFIVDITEWDYFTLNIEKSLINDHKKRIKEIREEFTWDSVIHECNTYSKLKDY